MSTSPTSETANRELRTQDQRRAHLVYENVRSIENKPFAKKYGGLALPAATLIRQCGLVQALAFYEAKAEDHHKQFVAHLRQELKQLGFLPTTPGKDGLREEAMRCDLTDYMRLTKETLALCQWHKRFAQSILKVQPGED